MEPFSRFNPNVEPLAKVFGRNAAAILQRDQVKRPKLVSHKGISDGSADRVLAGESNLTFKTLQAWATALKTPAWMLLHPDFDGSDALVAMTEGQLEAEVTRRLKEMLSQMSGIIGGLSDEGETRSDGRSAGKPFGDLKAPTGESKPNEGIKDARKPKARRA